MKVKEINKDILEMECFVAFESEDDNFFREKAKEGYSMELSSKELHEKSKLVCMNNEMLLEKYGNRDVLLFFGDIFSAMLGRDSSNIVISAEG